MILTLASFILIITAIILYRKALKTCLDRWFALSLIASVISVGCFLFSVITIVDTRINKDIDYQNALHEREMLEYRIEHIEDNITGNELIYKDVVEFNNELRVTKKWANSLWTNWFYNQDIAALDYIEIGK